MTRAPRVGWKAALAILIALPLIAFFAFVGYMKALAPLAELRRHGAWTVHLPETLGRIVGWSELVGAALLLLALVLPRLRMWASPLAALFIVNQLAAAMVHAASGETAALPQNAVLIALFAALGWLARSSIAERTPQFSPETL